MAANPAGGPFNIFEDGRLRPGIYKIQNMHTRTYLDIHEHSKQMCCRPAENLEDGTGLWEIRSLGAGYGLRRVEPGRPEQYCTPMEGLNNGNQLYVTAYPAAWRIEIADEGLLRGFEYVRFYWGPSKKLINLEGGSGVNGAKVESWDDVSVAWHMWKLIPVNVEGM